MDTRSVEGKRIRSWLRRTLSILAVVGLMAGVLAPATSALGTPAKATPRGEVSLESVLPHVDLATNINRGPQQIASLACAVDGVAVTCVLVSGVSGFSSWRTATIDWLTAGTHTATAVYVLTDGNVVTFTATPTL